ncbi:hypothetical protein MRX96_001858 [Rhipicephalus microplus]
MLTATVTVLFALSAQVVPAAGVAPGTPNSKLSSTLLDLERLFFLGSERRRDNEQLRERELFLGLLCRLGVSMGAFMADRD